MRNYYETEKCGIFERVGNMIFSCDYQEEKGDKKKVNEYCFDSGIGCWYI